MTLNMSEFSDASTISDALVADFEGEAERRPPDRGRRC